MAQTREGLQRTTGRIETTNELIRKRNLERTTVRNGKERIKHIETPGRISK